MKISSIKKSPKFPKFIRNSKGLGRDQKIKKIFPSLGLDNSAALVSSVKIATTLLPKESSGRLADWQTHTIVFSSNKRQGVWDIATMSMRGINSCQSWHGGYRKNLVGSILDPCVGIIYITNNQKLNHGTRMLFRALVRYVINRKTKNPKLMLELIYPNHSDLAAALFKKFLADKTNHKLDIIVPRELDNYAPAAIERHVIPRTKVVDRLANELRSYRDSDISYTKKIYNLNLS